MFVVLIAPVAVAPVAVAPAVVAPESGSLLQVLTHWDLLGLLVPALLAFAYQDSWNRAAGHGVRLHTWWHRAWMAGCLVTAIALASPVGVYADVLFSVHMVQHLLLILVAAPLFVLGAPVTVVAAGLGRHGRPARMRRFSSGPLSWFTHPVIAWPAFIAFLYASHLTGLYDAALRNGYVHAAEHQLYVLTAFLFWSPLLDGDRSRKRLPLPAKIAYVLVTMPAMAFLGLALFSSEKVLYDQYATISRTWGPSVLDDQRIGSMIMWVVPLAVMLPALLLIINGAARREERVQERLEQSESPLVADRGQQDALDPAHGSVADAERTVGT